MSWSGSKRLNKKWYRIRENAGGQKEILEADGQWAIEKGQSDTTDDSFNHYFMIDGSWFAQKDVAHKYLFVDTNARLALGYEIERLNAEEGLDELFATLQPIQQWVVFLEERLNDCELAIQFQLGDVKALQKKIKLHRNAHAGDCEQEIRQYQEKITECVKKIQRLQIQHEELVAKLYNEEGIEWGGMQCCAEISHMAYADLLAKFLNDGL